MLRLNKKIEYALLALLDLEEHGHTKEARTVKQIVAESRLPKALAGKIMQALNRSGIVTSLQGINGGYFLAREARQILLKDIIEAVDGPVALVDCLHINSRCASAAVCQIQSPMEKIHQGIVRYLLAISLADIRAMQNGAMKTIPEPQLFSIASE